MVPSAGAPRNFGPFQRPFQVASEPGACGCPSFCEGPSGFLRTLVKWHLRSEGIGNCGAAYSNAQ